MNEVEGASRTTSRQKRSMTGPAHLKAPALP